MEQQSINNHLPEALVEKYYQEFINCTMKRTIFGVEITEDFTKKELLATLQCCINENEMFKSLRASKDRMDILFRECREKSITTLI